ncbi:hypothetical protein N5J23_16905 [Comamonas aquatica]|uniref:MH2 domain-containing protein n=1 Tax=Comamonas aquatica TaxID=225991 RepID=A0AA42W640_9BURK|nr:hypothetical protein [Comamonas aquatica]MDH1429844.1 hypothetical protein [Comamonas aquatica]MDH1607476.1 hypothetical protein [Comamonas aquatica]MDH1619210.1 hypothetical protein [Comamonas aquatica]MDH2007193.1 hypothetical protein [Comamonas aquatica]
MTTLGNFNVLARLKAFAGLDIHVLATVLFRAWGILAGSVTIILLPLFLSPIEQGFYYTFASVLALQVFFELGLNHVLTQLAGHSAAHLHRTADGSLQGDLRWRRKVVSLIALSNKWNAIMASIFAAAMLTGGIYFFAQRGTMSVNQWIVPWITLIIAAAVNLALSARLAICEGVGEVADVAQLRLRQSMVGYLILWAMLLSGQGLMASVAVPLTSAVFTAWWLWRHPRFKRLREEVAQATRVDAEEFEWRRDIFPLQWRIALSWASGYFIFNFITPVIFALQGPVEAGRLGLALTVFSAVSTIGISWIAAKIPTFSGHIARQERTALNTLFDHQLRRSLVATLVCSLGVVLAAYIAGQLSPKVLDRLPPLSSLLMLAVVTVTNAAVFAMAAYMRAHKEEPLLLQSIVTALLIGVGVFIGAHHSLQASVAAYAGATMFVSLPWCALIYFKYRSRIT